MLRATLLISFALAAGPAWAQYDGPQSQRRIYGAAPHSTPSQGHEPSEAHVVTHGPGYGQAATIPTPTLQGQAQTSNRNVGNRGR